MRPPRVFRALLRTPLVTAAAVGALGLALGAVTLVASVVDGVLLRRLPFADPERLVVIWETNVPRGRFENVASPANFLHWRDAATSFRDLAAVTMPSRATFGEPGPPEEVPQQLVAGRLFAILGVDAARGRTFTPDEDRPGSDVALISHRLWERRFGGDPGLVGRRVRISGEPRTIVGVMPPGFAVLDPSVDVWAPIGFDERARTPRGRFIIVIGRLTDGVSVTSAQSEMTNISANLTAKFPTSTRTGRRGSCRCAGRSPERSARPCRQPAHQRVPSRGGPDPGRRAARARRRCAGVCRQPATRLPRLLQRALVDEQLLSRGVPGAPGAAWSVGRHAIDHAGIHEAMRVRLVRGRYLTPADRDDSRCCSRQLAFTA